MLEVYHLLENLAKTKYSDIVFTTKIMGKRTRGSSKLRIIFKDSSFFDVWFTNTGKYSYHWEQRAQRGIIYRHDNAPDHPEIHTYPKHLHDGTDQNIKPSNLSNDPQTAFVYLLDIVRKSLSK